MFDMPKGLKTPKNKSNAEVDGGIGADWGKTSRDYAEHRPGPPLSFYQKLAALEIGLPGQTVLDLGTGTGVIARQMARQGCKVWATHISDTQVKMAQTLATEENLDITFATA
jgi:2-polyprenyl-3-methyl-5-hydroxy-6-metoxy-1,4-benzoquinol methylase